MPIKHRITVRTTGYGGQLLDEHLKENPNEAEHEATEKALKLLREHDEAEKQAKEQKPKES